MSAANNPDATIPELAERDASDAENLAELGKKLIKQSENMPLMFEDSDEAREKGVQLIREAYETAFIGLLRSTYATEIAGSVLEEFLEPNYSRKDAIRSSLTVSNLPDEIRETAAEIEEKYDIEIGVEGYLEEKL
jgi:hypothetical protein